MKLPQEPFRILARLWKRPQPPQPSHVRPIKPTEEDEDDYLIRELVSRQWAEDWDSEEDAIYDKKFA